MRRASRKIYLSLILLVSSLLTMVATTFAWVGIVSNSSFERLTINLETNNEKSDYGIMLSLTGKEGDFHDSIDPISLKKQLLLNMGVPENNLKTELSINNTFNQIKLAQCTTAKDWDDSSTVNKCYYLDPFKTLNGNNPYANLNGKTTNYKGYFEFDLWITIYKIGDSNTGSEKKLIIYLRNGENGGLFGGEKSSAYIANKIYFPDSSNPLSIQYLKAENGFEAGKMITGNVSINPAGAVRLALQKAKSVELYDYTNSNNYMYNGLKIYKYGSDIPTYDSKQDLYDFGGILPADYNFARLHYNSTHSLEERLEEVPEQCLPSKRGDVTFADDGETNYIVDTSDNVTTNDMIKIHFSFWFEGWDSDCFEAINDQPVSMNLNFSSKDPDEL